MSLLGVPSLPKGSWPLSPVTGALIPPCPLTSFSGPVTAPSPSACGGTPVGPPVKPQPFPVDSSLQGGQLLGSCPPPLSEAFLVSHNRVDGCCLPHKLNTGFLSFPRPWSSHPASLCPGLGCCVLWMGIQHFPDFLWVWRCLFDLFTCVFSVPGKQWVPNSFLGSDSIAGDQEAAWECLWAP